MAIKPIDRISMPDDRVFLAQYVYKRKPVIITNLFEGQPIRQVRCLNDARSVFGTVKLNVQVEYAVATSSSRSLSQTLTFNEYWDFVQANPTTRLLCTEYDIPARVMMLFKLPSICARRNGSNDNEFLALPRKYGDYDLHENVFLANSLNKAHLHYDGDHRQVILYQVFGRKNVILFQPKNGIPLRPLDSPFYGGAGVFLDEMSTEQKLAFIAEADGYSGTLHPGDAIYMPMLIWHHVEYVEDAMSFNIRFARNKYGRFLCVDNFHRDYYIQNFASDLGDPVRTSSPEYQEAMASILKDYLKPRSDMLTKIEDMRRLFKELCIEFCPDSRPNEYCPKEREQEDLDRILSDIGSTMRYADPRVVAPTRPIGSISQLQKRQLEDKARSCGYSNEVLQHLLSNRLGKPSIDLLTKAEAAVFLSYMRSPGSVM